MGKYSSKVSIEFFYVKVGIPKVEILAPPLLRLAATGWLQLWAARGHEWIWLANAGQTPCMMTACFWPIVGQVSVAPALYGPLVAILISRLAMPSVEGCFDGLIFLATLAYEL